MNFKSEKHRELYNWCIKKSGIKESDRERKSLFYILAGNDDLAPNINEIYDFSISKGVINPDCIEKLYLTNSSRAMLELGFNLFNNYKHEEQLTVLETFLPLDEENLRIAFNAIKLRLNVTEKI